MAKEKLRVRDLLPAIGFSGFAVVLGFVGYMRAPEIGEMAVVFPPWVDSNIVVQSIVRSGAQFISPAKMPNVFVIRLQSDEVKSRLRQSGAVFFAAASGICGPVSQAILIRE